MNNVVLQRLIHGYQLIDSSKFDDRFNAQEKPFISGEDGPFTPQQNFDYESHHDFHNPNFGNEFSKEWAKTFTIPPHTAMGMKQATKYPDNGAEYYDKDTGKFLKVSEMTEMQKAKAVNFTIPPRLMRNAMQNLSKDITQAGKFYLNVKPEEELTQKEIKDCIQDIRIYCPYPKTFLQYETPDFVFNLLATEVMTEAANEEDAKQYEIESGLHRDTAFHTVIDFNLNVWSKEQKAFQTDLSTTRIYFHKDSEDDMGCRYQHEVLPNFWSKVSVQDHPAAETFRGSCFSIWLAFMCYMQYPQIATPNEKKGRANQWFDIPMKKHSASEYRNKPTFAHIEVDIKMFESHGNVQSNGKTEGKALHSVRKHLRTYSTGKKTWVKAHFRGSKEYGIVTKDYNVPSQIS